MKKKIVIIILLITVFATAIFSWAIVQAFATVKPTTDAINNNLDQTFRKIVRVPKEIPPSLDFSQVSYLWEMETLDKEVIEVRFLYTPSYSSREKEIEAILEMTEKGDPSIFDKVLPALIADNQSLDTARDPQKTNFGPNEKAGYSSLAIAKDLRGDKTIKIKWIYQKDSVSESLKSDYQKLSRFPYKILKTLYSLPGFLASLVNG